MTLAERADLASNNEFRSRIGMAAMQIAIGVTVEPPETAEHVVRLRLAVWTLTDQEVVRGRLSLMAAAVESVTPQITDAEIVTLLTDNWTLVAQIFTGQK